MDSLEESGDCVKGLSGVEERIRNIREWLKKEAPECFVEQKHTNECTQERIYWHHGYMLGLKDALRFLTGDVGRPAGCAVRTLRE